MDMHFRNACYNGDLDYITKMINKDLHFYKHYQYNLLNPIFLVSSRGHLDCLQFLIRIIPFSYHCWLDCVLISCVSGHDTILDFLFSLKVNFDKNDEKLKYAVQRSLYYNHYTCSTILQNHGIFS